VANFRYLALFAVMFFSCSFYDEADKDKNYGTEKIGDQIWMSENLNKNVSGSKCYDNDEANCEKYGRLYNWATAMALPDSCNFNSCVSKVLAKHRGICPSGWHIPSDAEWKVLVDSAGGSSIAGRYLKATNGWHNCGKGSTYLYKCEDKYGFSAMPGGIGNPIGNFSYIGDYGYWWSASEYRNEDAYYRELRYISDVADWYNYGAKNKFLSVRCVRD